MSTPYQFTPETKLLEYIVRTRRRIPVKNIPAEYKLVTGGDKIKRAKHKVKDIPNISLFLAYAGSNEHIAVWIEDPTQKHSNYSDPLPVLPAPWQEMNRIDCIVMQEQKQQETFVLQQQLQEQLHQLQRRPPPPPPPLPQQAPWQGTNRIIAMSKHQQESRSLPPQPKHLTDKSILANKFIPHHLKAINLSTVNMRWVCGSNNNYEDGNGNACGSDMEQVISSLVREFIPIVPCVCKSEQGRTSPGTGINGIQEGNNQNATHPLNSHPNHGHCFLSPEYVHQVPPDFGFALSQSDSSSTNTDTGRSHHISSLVVDLDETDSISEYCSTFRHSLQLEHEECMRLYENYSLHGIQVHPLEEESLERNPRLNNIIYKKARLAVNGISDARPSLQVDDIVLLRPLQHIFVYGPYGNSIQQTVQIESRVLGIVRGRREEPDQVILSWELSEEQRNYLKDPLWVRLYTVRFVPSSTILERCLTALDWMEQRLTNREKQCDMHEAMQDVLFPVMAPKAKPLPVDQRTVAPEPLNELQASFVRMVRARTLDHEFGKVRPPMILTGPAGTGKTKALMAAIADVLGLFSPEPGLKKNRVLVCAPSHAAADVITQRLSDFLQGSEIFRLYDESRPANTVPRYIIPFTCQSSGSSRFTLPHPSVWAGFRVIVCTCIDAHILYRCKITNEAIKARRQCFRSFLLSEQNNPLSLSFNGEITGHNDPFFSHLFVDEAAQATEPEILIPLSCVLDPHPGGKKVEVALVGDPRQLSPKIFSDKASTYGLGRSFMERLLRRPVECLGGGDDHMLGPMAHPDSLLNEAGSSLKDLIRYYAFVDGQEHLTIFLTENYRGQPSFLMMPSSFFYFDRLRSAKTSDTENLTYWSERLLNVESLSSPMLSLGSISTTSDETTKSFEQSRLEKFSKCYKQKWPIHFRGVKGKDTSIAIENFTGTDSWQNTLEADTVVEVVSELIRSGVDSTLIGVMTPFRGQVVTIRKKLRLLNYDDVNVGTIENYQAVEQSVIVFSLCRSNEAFVEHDIKRRMGVFGQNKQTNVAMTRSEHLFIVIGNPDVMWNDLLWRQWLWFCFRNGLWYGEGLAGRQESLFSSKGMRFYSMLEQVEGVANDDKQDCSVVVSTLEKVHRRH